MLRPTRAVVVMGVLAVLAWGEPVLRAAVPAARFDGKPAFKEGQALGYFVWKDGDTWKVRWTTFGAERRFSGNVTLDGGAFASFKRIDMDTGRRVVRPGRSSRVVRGAQGRTRVVPGRPAVVESTAEDRIEQEDERRLRFVTRTDDDIDGFDFKVTEATRQIRFHLEIDGKVELAEIEIGARSVRPGDDPLVAELR